jgi:hypothetical protein
MDYARVYTKLYWQELIILKYLIGVELEDSKEIRFPQEK